MNTGDTYTAQQRGVVGSSEGGRVRVDGNLQILVRD